MRKKAIPLLFLASLALIITVIFIRPEKNNVEITSESTVLCRYIIGEYDGLIALFENGSEKPKKVYPVFASSLPESDYERIKSGIKAENEDIAAAILDDYLS